jgi:hypothetical protein
MGGRAAFGLLGLATKLLESDGVGEGDGARKTPALRGSFLGSFWRKTFLFDTVLPIAVKVENSRWMGRKERWPPQRKTAAFMGCHPSRFGSLPQSGNAKESNQSANHCLIAQPHDSNKALFCALPLREQRQRRLQRLLKS